jgi:hypothetical protein
MQEEGQGWSWQEGRHFYHNALAGADSSGRDQGWADTFRALGQVMHLVEDAAQPAHVRNDGHGMDAVCHALFDVSCFANFEYWVSGHPNSYAYSGAAPFSRTILDEATGHPEAAVPVARLLDTDTYHGNDPNVTLDPAIGLAEFTNANFFSEDTGSGWPFAPPFPDVHTLVSSTKVVSTSILRRYMAKGQNDGIQFDPALVEGVFSQVAAAVLGVPLAAGQDDKVWEAEAQILVPKAVDYAQGALDYFFRGRIDFMPDPDNSNTFLIKNLGPDDMSGTFTLYYDNAAGNREPVPGTNGCRRPAGGMVVAARPGSDLRKWRRVNDNRSV